MSVAARGRADVSSKRRLKAWIRLLGVTRAAEGALREFLRVAHGTTLPRFDVMAALHRRREGVTMSQLSRMLLVSNGNATAVVDRLEQDGLVRRMPSPSDRRSVLVALTPLGTNRFEALAVEHEAEVARLFAPLSDTDLDRLTDILRRLARHDSAAALDSTKAAAHDGGARAWTEPS